MQWTRIEHSNGRLNEELRNSSGNGQGVFELEAGDKDFL